jgi:hypothetical protein
VKATLLVTISLMGLLVTVPWVGASSMHSGATDRQGSEPNDVVIVVVGAAGTAEYAGQFAGWAKLWERACAKSGATFLSIGLEENPGPPDRASIERILAEQCQGPPATLWLVLIGHGTYDGRTARFNLRGPDLSAGDLAEWLKPLQGAVAVINTASSSAPFLKELSAPGRVIITATKSGFEQNFARFGGHLGEAVTDPGADLDKDGQTSLLEAFLRASHAVAEFYKAAGRLATEHALLDDNGDGLGASADWFQGVRPTGTPADGTSLDGYRAHQLHLLRSPLENAMPPALQARRDELELQLVQLRDLKAKLPEQEYLSRLEPLLVEIARIYEQAERADDSPPRP